MEIKKLNNLSQEEIEEIRELEKLAYEPEQLENQVFLSNELNFNLEAPCFYLAYEGKKLVSFLTTFMPTSWEAEILGFTHPEYRKQGYFKALFEEAKEILINIGMTCVLWAIETKSDSGKSALKHFKESGWERSEYRMCYEGKVPEVTAPKLNFIKVDTSNRHIFAKCTKEAFPELENDSNYIDTVINAKDRVGYIGFCTDNPVGIFNLKDEEEASFIYGVAVVGSERSKGYGKAIIKHALEEGLKIKSKVILDVDSENPIAFNLYKKFGFQVTFQVDYYHYFLK